MEKVTEGGPWDIIGKSVSIADCDVFSKPTSIVLNKLNIWIQIHDLPEGYRALVPFLVARLGNSWWRSFHHMTLLEKNRVRVKIDVSKPLKLDVLFIR